MILVFLLITNNQNPLSESFTIRIQLNFWKEKLPANK